MRVMAALVVLSGCAAATPYMPLAVGNTWMYAVTSPEGAGRLELRINALDDRGFAMTEPDGRIAHWRIEDGYLVLDRGREIIPFFEVPARTGVSWSFTGEDEKTYYIKVRGYEDVEVPAGRFARCLAVSLEDDGRSKTALFHFARGVGMVRREQAGETGRVLIELERHGFSE